MKQNDSLFHLVKTLDKSERRYIKLRSGENGKQKNYFRLLTEINRQAESKDGYNEKSLKEKFNKEKISAYFPVSKNYLNELILKNLVQYHSDKIIESKIYSQLCSAIILYHKALYGQFYKKIVKAKNTALKYGRFAFVLQIIEIERAALMEKMTYTENKNIFRQETEMYEKQKNLSDYNNLAFNIIETIRESGKIRQESIRKKIDCLANIYLLSSEKYALSVSAKERYFYLNQVLAYTSGRVKEMMGFMQKRYEIINQNKSVFEGKIPNYEIEVLLDLLQSFVYNNDEKNISKYLKIIQKLTVTGYSEKIAVQASVIEIKLLMTWNEKNRKVASEVINETISFIRKFNDSLPPETGIVLLMLLALVCLRREYYKEALDAVNLVLQSNAVKYRKEIEHDIRIIAIIIHYELGNYNYVEYLSGSLNRYLKKNMVKFRFETIIINLVVNLSKTKDSKASSDLLSIALNNIRKLKKIPFESNSRIFDVIVDWIHTKIRKI